MIRVVLDTNVIVSALNFPQSNVAQILALIQEGTLLFSTSRFILEELEGVLCKKFKWRKDRAQQARELIRSMAELVEPQVAISLIKEDDDDNRILECAEASAADFLITGDKGHLLPLKAFRNIRIISPAEFIKLYT